MHCTTDIFKDIDFLSSGSLVLFVEQPSFELCVFTQTGSVDLVKPSYLCDTAHMWRWKIQSAIKPHSLIFQAILQHTHTHFCTESSQMFSISAAGLCWGTGKIRGEFHVIKVEQYTQQVSVRPTVASYFNNLTDSLPWNNSNTEKKLLLFPQRLARSSVVLTVLHLLALSLSC